MRYRAIPRQSITDLRQVEDADVSVKPASSTTHDEPQLTDPDVAPEASPAKTSNKGKSTTAKSATKAASKAKADK